MKMGSIIIGIVIILTIVCSPALAISKSDLIASYKDQTKSPEWAPDWSPANTDWQPPLDAQSFKEVLYPSGFFRYYGMQSIFFKPWHWEPIDDYVPHFF